MTFQPGDHPGKGWQVPFFTLWTGQALSLLGSKLVQFALIWWLTRQTGSATVLTTASLVGLLPEVLIGPVAGALVDRWSRRAVMAAADSLVALATLGLALLFLAGHVQVWQIYLVMLVRSLAGSFHWPAMQSSTSLMVPRAHLARLQGLNQMLNGAMNIVAAPLGALLLEVLPVQGVLAIDVITAAMAVLPLAWIRVPQPARSLDPPEGRVTVWRDLKAGLSYVAAWPGLVLILLMATLINLVLNPGFALLPLLVTKHFNGQALQLAWLESSLGIGVVGGGLLLGIWGGFKRRILTSLLGLAVIGAGSITAGLAPASALPLAVAAMFILGIGTSITNGPLLAVIQAAVAPEMQGRVFTLIASMAGAMTPLGLILAGPLADRFGAQAWFILAGATTLFLSVAGRMVPAVVYLEDGRSATQAYAPAEPGRNLEAE